MNNFIIKKIDKDIDGLDLDKIGFSKNYTEAMLLKMGFEKIKIYDLTTIQANILKQTALSNGCDCATDKGCLDNSVERTDVILFGTIKQLFKVIKSLQLQQFKMPDLANQIKNLLDEKNIYTPKVMGILNLTENSFSDGGKYLDFDKGIAQAIKMINDGADIIDIGAESTRPGSDEVEPQIQIERIIPVLKELVNLYPNIEYSIDTRSAEVANEVLKIKDVIINDVSGLTFDEKMLDVIVENNTKIIICHSSSIPKDMQQKTNYKNVIDDVYKFLYNQSQKLLDRGINKENIILDVGFGFGKTVEQNFELIKNFRDFQSLGYPILAGISRKSFIQKTIKNADLDELTASLNGQLLLKGASIFRVHDVLKTKQTIELFSALL